MSRDKPPVLTGQFGPRTVYGPVEWTPDVPEDEHALVLLFRDGNDAMGSGYQYPDVPTAIEHANDWLDRYPDGRAVLYVAEQAGGRLPPEPA